MARTKTNAQNNTKTHILPTRRRQVKGHSDKMARTKTNTQNSTKTHRTPRRKSQILSKRYISGLLLNNWLTFLMLH